jgi:hypothetical protein
MSQQATISPSLAALTARTDLAKYGGNAIALFAIETAFSVEDIHTVAALALTDGGN